MKQKAQSASKTQTEESRTLDSKGRSMNSLLTRKDLKESRLESELTSFSTTAKKELASLLELSKYSIENVQKTTKRSIKSITKKRIYYPILGIIATLLIGAGLGSAGVFYLQGKTIVSTYSQNRSLILCKEIGTTENNQKVCLPQ